MTIKMSGVKISGDMSKRLVKISGAGVTVPGAAYLYALAAQDGSLTAYYGAPDSDGGTNITDYEYTLDGETWVPPTFQPLIDAGVAEDDIDLAAKVAQLTQQQYKVLYYLTEGWLNKQIAYELSVSEATVKAHVSAILQKLDVDSRTQAVIAASKIAAGQWTGVSQSIS